MSPEAIVWSGERIEVAQCVCGGVQLHGPRHDHHTVDPELGVTFDAAPVVAHREDRNRDVVRISASLDDPVSEQSGMVPGKIEYIVFKEQADAGAELKRIRRRSGHAQRHERVHHPPVALG